MPYQTQEVQHPGLITLAELAGINATPDLYRIIVELLALQVSPEDVYTLLKQICQLPSQRK